MNTPIFDSVCVEYPEILWWHDTTTLTTFQGEVVREIAGPLHAAFDFDFDLVCGWP